MANTRHWEAHTGVGTVDIDINLLAILCTGYNSIAEVSGMHL